MSAAQISGSDFRYALIGELGARARRALKPAVPLMAVLLGSLALYQIFSGRPSGFALALITVGGCIAIAAWRKNGQGLPLMPMIVLQHVVVYALPLIVTQETIASYPQDFLTKAGIELLVFFLTLTIAWRMGMRQFSLPPPFCYGLREFNRGGTGKMSRIGFFLIVTTFLYQILERTPILESLLAMLPNGVTPIIWAIVSAAGTCGFFIVSLLLGGRALPATRRAAFWLFLAGNCYIAASSFLLSSALIMVLTVMIGLFWSTGRIPWLYLTVVMALFSFFNIGKVVMRERYWGPGGADDIPVFNLTEIPGHYAEWVEASYDCIIADNADQGGAHLVDQSPEEGHGLLERINNMQNLLFVVDAVERQHIEPLHGKTYWIIPELFIPRVLWSEKPGTHEGQAILNVHFGRQDLLSTTTTYIAWGLLPEAYGNFGPILGSVFLGAFLGLAFAWIERYTANKLVISVEGFIAFTVFLAMANSFELVASVLVTVIEQSIVPIVAATAPFARRTRIEQPPP